MCACRSQITKITFEGKMFIVHIVVNEVCAHHTSYCCTVVRRLSRTLNQDEGKIML